MSYSGFASGVASKLFALQKLADSQVVDFPKMSFWLPFDHSMTTDVADVRWCRTRPDLHVTLRCPRRSPLLTAPTCPVKISSCPYTRKTSKSEQSASSHRL